MAYGGRVRKMSNYASGDSGWNDGGCSESGCGDGGCGDDQVVLVVVGVVMW